MEYVDTIAEAIDDETREKLLNTTRRTPVSVFEGLIGTNLVAHWHPLPKIDQRGKKCFAIDGSSGVRRLADGSHLIVVRALLVGKEGIVDRVMRVFVVPAYEEETFVRRYADMRMEKLEQELALRNIDKFRDKVLYFDGSLYGKIVQSVWSVYYSTRVEEDEEAPDVTFVEEILELFDKTKHNTTLIGISKTSRSAIYSHVFLNGNAPRQKRASRRNISVADASAIYRFTRSAGHTTPVRLGLYGIDETRFRVSDQSSERAKQLLPYLNEIKKLPMMVTFFLRYSPDTLPVRVDAPCWLWGIDQTIGDLYCELDTQIDLEPVLGQILYNYADDRVYNIFLWAADEEVRLTRQRLDQTLEIIGQQLGISLELDRSQRRFFG
jgi:hypothetical protein